MFKKFIIMYFGKIFFVASLLTTWTRNLHDLWSPLPTIWQMCINWGTSLSGCQQTCQVDNPINPFLIKLINSIRVSDLIMSESGLGRKQVRWLSQCVLCLTNRGVGSNCHLWQVGDHTSSGRQRHVNGRNCHLLSLSMYTLVWVVKGTWSAYSYNLISLLCKSERVASVTDFSI